MKSVEVYKLIREAFDPWTKQAGFSRGGRGMLNYARPHANGMAFETFWFQCSQDGWDPFVGSKFTLEFQLAAEPEPGHGRRARFSRLLSPAQREQVRGHQNAVIRKLRRPTRHHWSHAAVENVSRWYFAQFNEDLTPYSEKHDIWLRYGDETDVRVWVHFLLPLIPGMLEDFRVDETDLRSGA